MKLLRAEMSVRMQKDVSMLEKLGHQNLVSRADGERVFKCARGLGDVRTQHVIYRCKIFEDDSFCGRLAGDCHTLVAADSTKGLKTCTQLFKYMNAITPSENVIPK